MAKKKVLVLDANYLCHRAFFAMGGLSHEDVKTGVIFGVLRDIANLAKQFSTNRFAFCFDSPKSLREEVYPNYKSSRRKRKGPRGQSEEEAHQYQLDREELYRQIKLLHNDYLPAVGYKNVFMQEGYEADDLIASIVLGDGDMKMDYVIVSGDKDLYQLLDSNVSMWVPGTKQLLTGLSFMKEWQIDPSDWVKVKAIAGCSTDDIEGVPGVGEITAAKYVRGELPPKAQTYQDIKAMRDVWRENLKLVRLPYEGLEQVVLKKCEIPVTAWRGIAKKCGINSIDEVFEIVGGREFVSGRNRSR